MTEPRPTFATRAARQLMPLCAAVLFVAAPLAAQAPGPLPPASPPPPAPVATPAPALEPMPRAALPPNTTPAERASAPVPTVRADAPPPNGATMRCKDGTWLTGAPSAPRCDRNGGVALIVPVRAAPPAPPRRP